MPALGCDAGPVGPGEILNAWGEVLARRGDAVAILAPEGRALRTFREIDSEATVIAIRLGAFATGSIIGVQVGNDPSFPAILLALWRRGLVGMPLDASLTEDARAAALKACGAVAWLGRDGLNPCIHAAATLPTSALLKLTSGTSAKPRGIAFTQAQLLADCEAICDTMGLKESDVNYGVIPWSHSYGLSNLITPLLCRGIPVVATEDRLPRAILEGLRASGATVFPGVPVFFQKLAELPGDVAALVSLRLCISAGAPLPAHTASAFQARFGQKVHGFYGSSECGGIAYDASDVEVPEGCVGKPMKGVTLEWKKPEADERDAARFAVRSAAVGLGYHPQPEPEVLSEGRFFPSDLARFCPQGMVLVGRTSDFINVAGRKLNPAAVEAVLRGVPGVQEVMVFGVPCSLRGEEVIACVSGAVSRAQLVQACHAALPSWQVPRDFWCLEALPVNERGKLSRRTLAEAYRCQR